MNEPLSVPFFRPSIGEEEIAEVVESIRSGWLTTGPKTRQFEADFEAYIGNDVQAVAVNSATAAMHLALEALGIGPGDEVILPTLTFTATAEVVRYMGATPVLVDVDPATLNLRPEDVEVAITPRTKAVMPVHFAGLPCDMTRIHAIARAHDLKVVEDAAHALPTVHAGGMIGTHGSDAVCFSFYANKTMTTGEGGMLVSTNAALIDRARKMRLHGIDRDVFNRFTDNKASWRYDVVAPGFKYNMTDVAASLGIHQLRRCDGFGEIRTARAARYDAAFADLPLILPPHPPEGDKHSWHLYIVRMSDDAPVDRDQFIAALQEANIGISVHYTPLHLMSYWRDLGNYSEGAFPGAEDIFRRCVSLPHFMAMTDAEQDRVIEVVRTVLGG